MTKAEWFVIFVSRVILNLSFRVVYPFLPAISRGLDIPLGQAGLFLTARSAAGMAGMFFGIVGERLGYVRWMAAALAIMLLGSSLVMGARSFLWALAGFGLLGLAQTAYVPASQAYVSVNVPYSQRGRVIGLIELSWSASWFLGIPACGILIARFGWRSPFLLIALAALLFFALTAKLRPAKIELAIPKSSAASGSPAHRSPVGASPVLVMLATFFVAFSNENVMVILGAWLESYFSLKVEALGFFSGVAGVAELAGELTVALAVDRLGKRRTIIVGLLASGLAYLALIGCQHSLALAMPALMAAFFLFELTFVSMISVVSELSPLQRGKWLSANYSFNVAGRLCASLSGPWLWALNRGILPNAVLSCLCSLLGLALFLWFVTRSRRPPSSHENASATLRRWPDRPAAP